LHCYVKYLIGESIHLLINKKLTKPSLAEIASPPLNNLQFVIALFCIFKLFFIAHVILLLAQAMSLVLHLKLLVKLWDIRI